MLIRNAEIQELPESRRQHPLDADVIRMTRSLGDLAGLKRLGAHLVRLEPGRESTVFHYHDRDEELLFVLAGRGVAELGAETVEVGPGDFMGFPSGSEPHLLRNPFTTDLVYLVVGERNANDVVHYPRIRRTMIKSGGKATWAEWDDLHQL